MLPVVVDSSGAVGDAAALPGAPPICGIAGDQQASLVGQGCTLPGLAKATFGTGGMLDQCVGPGDRAGRAWGAVAPARSRSSPSASAASRPGAPKR